MEERRYDQIISTLYPKPPAAKRGGGTGNGRRSELVLFWPGITARQKQNPYSGEYGSEKQKTRYPKRCPITLCILTQLLRVSSPSRLSSQWFF